MATVIGIFEDYYLKKQTFASSKTWEPVKKIHSYR